MNTKQKQVQKRRQKSYKPTSNMSRYVSADEILGLWQDVTAKKN